MGTKNKLIIHVTQESSERRDDIFYLENDFALKQHLHSNIGDFYLIQKDVIS
jgi:hypothetical protein